MLTVENAVDLAEEHNNKNIRGRVQDRNQTITPEPMFKLSYYSDDDSRDNSAVYYMSEVAEANNTRALRHNIVVTLRDTGPANEDEIQKHFQSIEYYNSYMATHAPRAIDYLGRAMDFMMLHNYQSAILDLGHAVELTPDFTLAYFARANARYKEMKAREAAAAPDTKQDRHMANARSLSMRNEIIADLDKVISLSPRMAIAYYNKGCVLAEGGDIDRAIEAFSRAIQLEPGLGVAYYNRGFQYFQLGDSRQGSADLSRAGELGIVPSYNLLKRMHR